MDSGIYVQESYFKPALIYSYIKGTTHKERKTINVRWILLETFSSVSEFLLYLIRLFHYVKYNACVGLITFYFGGSLKSTPIFIPWMSCSGFPVDFRV